MAWRGMVMDVSRHFYNVDAIKELLDLMAFYKLNVFHWHLADNEGWRLEIKKFNELQFNEKLNYLKLTLKKLM